MTGRVALCHEWVTTYGGSEQVAARLARVLDIEDIYTFAADAELARALFGDRSLHVSAIGTTGFALRRWQWLLPAMARWWRSIDLSSYELVITSSHAAVNSIRTAEQATHVSYCSTPMRYAWGWRAEIRRLPAPLRPVWPVVAAALRRGDRRRAANVDLFVANSRCVAGRIADAYKKDSIIVYPPVDTEFFSADLSVRREPFFLYAGRLVAYKRPDVVVRTASGLGVRLVVAGSGPELEHLQRLAGPTVEFVVQPSAESLRSLYRSARALVFAGVEDFGMVFVEAQACGTPVIARDVGGAAETVLHGASGHLYRGDSETELAEAIRAFDAGQYEAASIRRQAERFSAGRFDHAIQTIIGRILSESPDGRCEVVRELLAEASSGPWYTA